MKQPGFTIVELLIVIVVIAILAAISIVTYANIQERARIATMQSDFRTISQAIELYKVDHDNWPVCSSGGDLAWTECQITSIASLSDTLQRVPTTTGKNHVPIRYVASSSTNRWAIRFQKGDGTYCKMGHNYDSAWWAPAPACW